MRLVETPQHKLKHLAEAVLLGKSETEVAFAVSEVCSEWESRRPQVFRVCSARLCSRLWKSGTKRAKHNTQSNNHHSATGYPSIECRSTLVQYQLCHIRCCCIIDPVNTNSSMFYSSPRFRNWEEEDLHHVYCCQFRLSKSLLSTKLSFCLISVYCSLGCQKLQHLAMSILL